MPDSTDVADEAEYGFAPEDIEPEDPGEDSPESFFQPSDVQDGELEDDSGFLSNASIFSHLDDGSSLGPNGLSDLVEGGQQ